MDKLSSPEETHRNCITNDLFTTVQLLDAVPAMRLAVSAHAGGCI